MNAHKKLLNTKHKISWMTEVDSLESINGYFMKIGMSSNSSLEEWIEFSEKINSVMKIDKVVNFSEFKQDYAAKIAENLNIEYFNSVETINWVNNKNLMRERLKEQSFENVSYIITNQKHEVYDFFKKHPEGIIIKPVNGRGSQEITLVKEDQDIENLNFGSSLYIEQFLIGNEFSVEAFSKNGKHNIMAITQKFKDTNTFVEYAHFVPANLDNKDTLIIKKYIDNVLSLLNIENGVTHTEIMLCNKEPKIIETHLRLAGDRINEIVNMVTGINLLEIWINSVIEEDFYVQGKPKYKFAASYLKHNEVEGEIADIKHNYEKGENIQGVHIYKNIGDVLERTKSSIDRLASVVVGSNESGIDAINKGKETLLNLEYTFEQNK